MNDAERLAQIKSINEGYRTKPCCKGGYECVEAIDYLLARVEWLTDENAGLWSGVVAEANRQARLIELLERVETVGNDWPSFLCSELHADIRNELEGET